MWWCNPRTWETETRESKVQNQLEYIGRPSIKKRKMEEGRVCLSLRTSATSSFLHWPVLLPNKEVLGSSQHLPLPVLGPGMLLFFLPVMSFLFLIHITFFSISINQKCLPTLKRNSSQLLTRSYSSPLPFLSAPLRSVLRVTSASSLLPNHL